jgi:hypothetical protein
LPIISKPTVFSNNNEKTADEVRDYFRTPVSTILQTGNPIQNTPQTHRKHLDNEGKGQQ